MTVKELKEGQNNLASFLTNGYVDVDLKESILNITNNDLSMAKKVYAWVIEMGESKTAFRINIVKRYFDLEGAKANHWQDTPWQLKLDGIYEWLTEE